MKNLLAFLLRFQGVMLFVLLEVVSLGLFVSNSSYQRAAVLNSANAYAGQLLARRTEVTDYFRLGDVNQELLNENTRLRQQLLLPDYARREADSLPVGRDTLGRVIYRHLRPYPTGLRPTAAPAGAGYPDSLLLAHVKYPTHDRAFPLVPARIINNSLRSVDNYLTLNAGAADGVLPGEGVLAVGGVVGRVKSVSDHYATVTSLLHSKTAVAARLKHDGTFGSVSWPGDDYRYAQLDYIPRQNKLLLGDTILTSGYNAVFPAGVFIGTVEDFTKEPDKNFWTVRVRLGVDFSRLTYVYVVRQHPRAERDSLETALALELNPPKGGTPAAATAKAAAKPGAKAAPAPAAPAPAERYQPQNGLVSRAEQARREGREEARREYEGRLAAEAKARAAVEKLLKDKLRQEAERAKATQAATGTAQPLAPTRPTLSPTSGQ